MKKKSSPSLSETLQLVDQQNAELSIINSVQEAIVSEIDLQGIYDLVGDKIRDLFNAQVVGINTFNISKNIEHFNYLYEDGKRIFPKPRKLDKIRMQLIKAKKMILIDENLSEKVAEITGVPAKAIPGTKLPKSLILVPMIVRGEVRGYVGLQNLDIEHAFKDSEIRLINTLTNSMSVAIESASLFNETEQRSAELAVINSVQEGLVAEMDLQGIYDLVGNKIKELFDSQVTVIATFNHEKDIEIFNYVFEDGKRFYPEPRVFNNFRKHLIKTQKLIHIEENAAKVFKEFDIKIKAAPGTREPKTMLYVPLVLEMQFVVT